MKKERIITGGALNMQNELLISKEDVISKYLSPVKKNPYATK